MVTAESNPLMSTCTAASRPPSPKAPASTALRIRWLVVSTQTRAATGPLEFSCASRPLTCSGVYVVETWYELAPATWSVETYFGLDPEGITAGRPVGEAERFGVFGKGPASRPGAFCR